MRFDKGYISPYFIGDVERMETVLEEPYLLLVDKAVSRLRRPAANTGEGHGDGKAAGDHRGQRRGRSTCDPRREHHPRQTFQVGRDQSTRFGERRKATLGDLAILTGGQGHQRIRRRQP